MTLVGTLACARPPAEEEALPPITPEPEFSCGPGEAEFEGGCLAAGMAPSGCPAGELATESGCVPAGIPPEQCGEGFEADGQGACNAILPASPCPEGQLAVVGETRCRAVAPCAAGTWGDIPIEPGTEFVDAAYTGGASDGSAVAPWTRIQDALDAAASNDIVAVAAGTYAEDVLIERPVRLWGRCPSLVAISGVDPMTAALHVVETAAGSELHRVAVTGPYVGITIRGEQVLVDRVWVHHTGSYGLAATSDVPIAANRLAQSLVEASTSSGVLVSGSALAMASSVVRDVSHTASMAFGWGIVVQDRAESGQRGTASLLSSVIERNYEFGIAVLASDATIEASVVRDTKTQVSSGASGLGIAMQSGSTLDLRASVIERNHDIGVAISGSEAHIETTVVRDTQPTADDTGGRGLSVQIEGTVPANVDMSSSVLERNQEVGMFVAASTLSLVGSIVRDTQPTQVDGTGGRGVNVQGGVSLPQRSSATIVSSVLDANHEIGVYASGSDLVLDASVVRDTQAEVSKGWFGRGMSLENDLVFGERGYATIRYSLFEANHETGVYISGGDATIASTIVRDTQPDVHDQKDGGGMLIQQQPGAGPRANVVVNASVVERNLYFGILILSSDVTLDAMLVRDTAARANDGAFGDGVAVATVATAAMTTVTRSRIEGSARAGVANFGATVALSNATLECNVIPLDGEHVGAFPFVFNDQGGNVCGCPNASEQCAVRSSSLAAPEPPDS